MGQFLTLELLDLPADVPFLLFGAMRGGRDPRECFDLFTTAVGHLRGRDPGIGVGGLRPVRDAP